MGTGNVLCCGMAADVRVFSIFVLIFTSAPFLFGSNAQARQDNPLGDLADVISGFADILGDADECKYRCPNGATPRANPHHRATSNGCGSYGLKVDTSSLPGMTSCCDAHDLCYDTCNTNRKKCDADFQDCLNNMCRKQRHFNKQQMEECDSVSSLAVLAVKNLGCQAYLAGQREACLCTFAPPTTHKAASLLGRRHQKGRTSPLEFELEHAAQIQTAMNKLKARQKMGKIKEQLISK